MRQQEMDEVQRPSRLVDGELGQELAEPSLRGRQSLVCHCHDVTRIARRQYAFVGEVAPTVVDRWQTLRQGSREDAMKEADADVRDQPTEAGEDRILLAWAVPLGTE